MSVDIDAINSETENEKYVVVDEINGTNVKFNREHLRDQDMHRLRSALPKKYLQQINDTRRSLLLTKDQELAEMEKMMDELKTFQAKTTNKKDPNKTLILSQKSEQPPKVDQENNNEKVIKKKKNKIAQTFHRIKNHFKKNKREEHKDIPWKN